MRISMPMARRLALHCQGFLPSERWNLPAGKGGVAQAIEHLGYVQIDTISVVQRAHHHTLWARRPDYDPHMLHQLHAQDRRVFEWWAPAMSYVPMRDYRYYQLRMRSVAGRERVRTWLQENEQLARDVLARIRAEGPLRSADFKAPEGFKRGTWWSWKPAKRALEVLFDSGELLVTERRNFQRVYDLRERVLPGWVDKTVPGADELARFVARRALGGLGLVTVEDVRWGRRKIGAEVLLERVEAGEVTSFEVEGLKGQTWYALTDVLEAVAGERADGASLHVLSPFDNLVIRRGWLERIFGFRYKLEAYTPATKRVYGYFCLPLLWGDRLVGRMDAKADRKSRTLIVRNLALEPGFDDHDRLLPSLAEKLHAFAVFNGCERIVVERTNPPGIKVPLERALDRNEHPSSLTFSLEEGQC